MGGSQTIIGRSAVKIDGTGARGVIRSADIRIVGRVAGLSCPTRGEIGGSGDTTAKFIEVFSIGQYTGGLFGNSRRIVL